MAPVSWFPSAANMPAAGRAGPAGRAPPSAPRGWVMMSPVTTTMSGCSCTPKAIAFRIARRFSEGLPAWKSDRCRIDSPSSSGGRPATGTSRMPVSTHCASNSPHAASSPPPAIRPATRAPSRCHARCRARRRSRRRAALIRSRSICTRASSAACPLPLAATVRSRLVSSLTAAATTAATAAIPSRRRMPTVYRRLRRPTRGRGRPAPPTAPAPTAAPAWAVLGGIESVRA